MAVQITVILIDDPDQERIKVIGNCTYKSYVVITFTGHHRLYLFAFFFFFVDIISVIDLNCSMLVELLAVCDSVIVHYR